MKTLVGQIARGFLVFIKRLVAPYFNTNCWVLATGVGSECFIVDPGIAEPDFVPEISTLIRESKLKPVAVLITHGHLDHTFSLFPLSQSEGIATCYVHSEDRELLANPEIGMGPQGRALLSELAPNKKWAEPDRVIELVDESKFEVAGMSLKAIHAPGHTRGSTMFMVNGVNLLSGDVLFKGAIGRSDLPTSDPEDMTKSLKEKVLTLDDSIHVLPGHGDETSIGAERANNPYLQGLL